MDNKKVMIFDRRLPGYPILELIGHSQYVNSIAWAANSPYSTT